MSRTLRRRHGCRESWESSRWLPYSLEDLPLTQRPFRFHQDWGFQTHHPPKAVRRQIEKRYRQRLRKEVALNQEERMEGVTPPRFVYGIGWFWQW